MYEDETNLSNEHINYNYIVKVTIVKFELVKYIIRLLFLIIFGKLFIAYLIFMLLQKN